MNLLYCRDGLVLAVHDDTAPYVDPDLYGDGTRVIPWAAPVSDLQWSGPLPDPMNPMPPPLRKEPDPTPEILTAYAAQVRYSASIEGITFNSIPVKTDRLSQTLINNLASYAQSLQPNAPISFTQDGKLYPMTAKQVGDMANAITAHIQDCRVVEGECITDLSSGSPTLKTYDDVDAKFAAAKRGRSKES